MYSLPRLLRSRAEVLPSKNRRPAPLDLQLLSTTEDHATAFLVKNTFIESAPLCSPSLRSGFFRERSVSSCPAEHRGRLADAFAVERRTPVAEFELPSPCQIKTPCGFRTPTTEAPQQPVRIALAALLAGSSTETCSPLQCVASIDGESRQSWCSSWLPHSGFGADSFLFSQVCDGSAAVHYFPATSVDVGEAAACWPLPCLSTAPAVSQAELAETPSTVITVGPLAAAPPPPPLEPAPGFEGGLPSIGSSQHAAGMCIPCAFFHTKGCSNGFACKFCHLCDRSARKIKRKRQQVKASNDIEVGWQGIAGLPTRLSMPDEGEGAATCLK